MKPKRIPITAAKELAKKYNYTQIIIVGFNGDIGGYHVTTYGTDKRHCKEAALGGDFVKKAIGGKWG